MISSNNSTINKKYILCVVLSIFTRFHGVSMLRLVTFRVPSHTIKGQPVRLECHYDLEGEALYSVKWFKDGKEFFRVIPRDNPPSEILHQPGIIVDSTKSSETAVVLKSVTLDGSGTYKCEVSAEAPYFKTASQSAHMSVVELPDGGPYIEGSQPRYRVGDSLNVNCTSFKSRPAAKLTWFVNSIEADHDMIKRFPILVDGEGLETATLGLNFKISKKTMNNGDLKIKCVATISNLYWRSNEESLEGDRYRNRAYHQSNGSFSTYHHDSSLASSSLSSIKTFIAVSTSLYYFCMN